MYALKLVPDTQITHFGTTEQLNKLKSLVLSTLVNETKQDHRKFSEFLKTFLTLVIFFLHI